MPARQRFLYLILMGWSAVPAAGFLHEFLASDISARSEAEEANSSAPAPTAQWAGGLHVAKETNGNKVCLRLAHPNFTARPSRRCSHALTLFSFLAQKLTYARRRLAGFLSGWLSIRFRET